MRSLLLGPAPRIVAVGLTVLAIQRVVFARHPFLDVKLQLLLALVVAAGAAGGADRGAVAGFVLGLMYDFAGNTPLGLMALCYGVGGIIAGYTQTLTPDPQWWLASLFATFGAAIGEASIPFVHVLTGQNGWVTSRMFWEVPVVAITAGIACTPLMPIGRWMMGVKRRRWKAMAS